MDITVTTEKYTAQTLQEALNPKQSCLCIVLGGEKSNEYIIVTANDLQTRLVKGMLGHLGVSLTDNK